MSTPRLKEKCVATEHDRVGADAEHERDDDHDRDGRRASHGTESVDQVSPESFDGGPRPCFSGTLANRQEIAELPSGGAFRLVPGHASANSFLDVQREIVCELLVQISVARPGPKAPPSHTDAPVTPDA